MAALRRGGGGQRGQMFAEEGEDGGVIEAGWLDLPGHDRSQHFLGGALWA